MTWTNRISKIIGICFRKCNEFRLTPLHFRFEMGIIICILSCLSSKLEDIFQFFRLWFNKLKTCHTSYIIRLRTDYDTNITCLQTHTKSELKLFLSPKFQIQEVVSESLVLDQPELVIQSETEAVEDKFENLVDQAEQKITEGKSIVFKVLE